MAVCGLLFSAVGVVLAGPATIAAEATELHKAAAPQFDTWILYQVLMIGIVVIGIIDKVRTWSTKQQRVISFDPTSPTKEHCKTLHDLLDLRLTTMERSQKERVEAVEKSHLEFRNEIRQMFTELRSAEDTHASELHKRINPLLETVGGLNKSLDVITAIGNAMNHKK
jgi:hypothetical protein